MSWPPLAGGLAVPSLTLLEFLPALGLLVLPTLHKLPVAEGAIVGAIAGSAGILYLILALILRFTG